MVKYLDTKLRVYEIIEKSKKNDRPSFMFDCFIIALILLNVLAVILESYIDLYNSYFFLFRFFEMFSVVIFTIEYCLRIWTADIHYNGLKKSNLYISMFFRQWH